MAMIRTQVQPDETTYALAKQRAFAESKSLAAIIREALRQYLTSPNSRSSGPPGIDGFTFVGSGLSTPGGPYPLSERHDDALAEDFGN